MSDEENNSSTLTREVNPRKSFAQEVMEAARERDRLSKERKENPANNKPEALIQVKSDGKITTVGKKKRKKRKNLRKKAAGIKTEAKERGPKSGPSKSGTCRRTKGLAKKLSRLVRLSNRLVQGIADLEKDLMEQSLPKKTGQGKKIRIESNDANVVHPPVPKNNGNEKPVENVDSEVDRGRQIIESFKRSLIVGERTKHLCGVRQVAVPSVAELPKEDVADGQLFEPNCFANRGPVELVVIRPNPLIKQKDSAEELSNSFVGGIAAEMMAGRIIPLGGENKSKFPPIELPESTLEIKTQSEDVLADGQEELKRKKESNDAVVVRSRQIIASLKESLDAGEKTRHLCGVRQVAVPSVAELPKEDVADLSTDIPSDSVLPTDSVVVGGERKQNDETSSSDDVDLGLTPVKSMTTSLKESLDPDELRESVSGGRKHLRGRIDTETELPGRRQEVILGRNRFRANNSKKKGKEQAANQIAEKSGGETKEIMPRTVPAESNRETTGAKGVVERKNKEAAGRGGSLLEEMKRERLKKQQASVPLGKSFQGLVANPLQATIWRNKKYRKTPLTKWVSVRTLRGGEWTVDEADRIAGLFNGECAGYCLLPKMKTVLILKIGSLEAEQIKIKLKGETSFPLISNTTMDMSLSETTRDELAKI